MLNPDVPPAASVWKLRHWNLNRRRADEHTPFGLQPCADTTFVGSPAAVMCQMKPRRGGGQRRRNRRHTATTILFLEGIPEPIIRKLTGHRSQELERYEHLSPLLNRQTVELIAQKLTGYPLLKPVPPPTAETSSRLCSTACSG